VTADVQTTAMQAADAFIPGRHTSSPGDSVISLPD